MPQAAQGALNLPPGYSSSCYLNGRAGRREAPPPGQPSLASFLNDIALVAHLPQLTAAGYRTVGCLAGVTDAELQAAGMSKVIHRRKLRRALEAMKGLGTPPPRCSAQAETTTATLSDHLEDCEPPALVDDEEDSVCPEDGQSTIQYTSSADASSVGYSDPGRGSSSYQGDA
eukprot:TRINITY_DN4299_c0_g2_i2.p1 TRINITY_DN4299_c0_g2~~TRINITY_DN4299_c0_g2_i2.p1  ORF type:complete len:201 (+),score=62.07 TRINITY_DN4299_c0_g2_i2:89-604(+)